ncbi:MAG: CinA family protein [Clostridia bacterium]|nr:CinA family protein [Clostridia bacterium]
MIKYTKIDVGENYTTPCETAEALSGKLNCILKEKRLTISVCESFTAGRISAQIIHVPGASAIFHEGIVSYSNLSKTERLSVKKKTLENFGAVSAECCAEMVGGLIATGECDVAISSTGIAGPNSDGTDKPVGLCYIGIATKRETLVYKYNLSGTREEITETAVKLALSSAIAETEKYKK